MSDDGPGNQLPRDFSRLALLATTAILGGCIAAPLPSTTSIASTAAANPSAEATAIPGTQEPTGSLPSGSPTLAWSPIDEQALGRVFLGPIVADGSEILAIGSPFGVAFPAGTWAQPTLWLSADGLTWRKTPTPSALVGKPDAEVENISGVVSRRSGVVAVGAEISADASTANSSAWTSADGQTWERATVAGSTDATMNLVVRTPAGYAAIGTNRYAPQAGFSHGTAVWTSPDGKRWSRLDQADVPPGIEIRSVAHGDHGFIGVGVAEPPGGGPDGFRPIWTSPDAVHWHMIKPVRAVPSNADLATVLWTESRFVAVGSEPTAGLRVWESGDGKAWTRASLPATVAGEDAPGSSIAGLAVTPVGLLAVGSVSDETGANHGAMWLAHVQADGVLAWSHVDLPSSFDDVVLTSIAVANSVVIVTGETASGDARAWVLDAAASAPSSGSDADILEAKDILTRYTEAIASEDYKTGWALLAPKSQSGFGSEAQFAADRSAFMRSAHDEFNLGPLQHDAARLVQWMPVADPRNPSFNRAYLMEVDYPVLALEPAGFDILVAAPDATGAWHVWIAR